MTEILVGIFTVVFIIITAFMMSKVKIDTRTICACGIASAATIILSMLVKIPIGINDASISFATVPIIVLSLIYGTPAGMLAGVVSAILSVFLVPGWAPVHPLQIPVEHYVCFVSLGLAGLYGVDKKYKVMLGVITCYIFKIIGHVLSGYIFFSEYAPEGMSAWKYTIVYNCTSKGIEVVLVVIIMSILPVYAIKKAIVGGKNK